MRPGPTSPSTRSDPAGVARLFAEADDRLGEPDVVLYNASARAHGPIAELDPEAVRKAIEISAFGGFLTVRETARRMIPQGRGAILLTGASASVKGYPHSAAFAMGKFALRGLAQSTARELGPKGIHVAHFVIDGGVRNARRPDPADRPDSTLDPDAIAQTYLDPAPAAQRLVLRCFAPRVETSSRQNDHRCGRPPRGIRFTGKGRYVDDIKLPGTLHLAILRAAASASSPDRTSRRRRPPRCASRSRRR
jgi:NAD(P)-dependent dehydrogenase (short-subunit alcohol dehydrogenase family)